MTTKQISVFLENRPGTLAEFCKVLQKNNIDMRAMCVADAMDFGIARVIVDNVYDTVTVLKDEGYVCQITKVLTVEMEDRPGFSRCSVNRTLISSIPMLSSPARRTRLIWSSRSLTTPPLRTFSKRTALKSSARMSLRRFSEINQEFAQNIKTRDCCLCGSPSLLSAQSHLRD